LPSANGSSAASATSRRRATAGPAPEGGAGPSAPERREAVMSVGAQLRESRRAAGLSLRQFARDLGVSPSFVSQIENGKSQPSVATLYTMCSKLNVSVDELFSRAGSAEPDAAPDAAPGAASGAGVPAPASGRRAATGPGSRQGALAELNASSGRTAAAGPVVTPGQRRRLVLDSGVTWEQLAPTREAAVDFLFVRYAVGGSSVANNELTRHSGVEYGYIISGTLEISLGFETYEVHAGESISFDSSTPHRLTNTGDVPVEAIWFVHGRNASHEH
jgi:transcriptional regulator with XRE-family HTH domain/mannose-6-phosphate isomerase-like protein (cupin superfamily)